MKLLPFRWVPFLWLLGTKEAACMGESVLFAVYVFDSSFIYSSVVMNTTYSFLVLQGQILRNPCASLVANKLTLVSSFNAIYY
jgi:hypothetical protein